MSKNDISSDAMLAAKFRELCNAESQEMGGLPSDAWDGWTYGAKELLAQCKTLLANPINNSSELNTFYANAQSIRKWFETEDAFRLYVLAVAFMGNGISGEELAKKCGIHESIGRTILGVWLAHEIVSPRLKR